MSLSRILSQDADQAGRAADVLSQGALVLLEGELSSDSGDELPFPEPRPRPPDPDPVLPVVYPEPPEGRCSGERLRLAPDPPRVRLDSCTPAYLSCNIDLALRRRLVLWTPPENYPPDAALRDPASARLLLQTDRRLLKTLIRQHGLLPSARPHLWPVLLARPMPELSLSDYREYVERAQLQPAAVRQIDMDLQRFALKAIPPGHPLRTQLRNVLLAFVAANRRMGYCQGMHVVCLAILMAGFSELGAFHVFRTIIEHILPDCFYDASLFGLQVDCRVLQMLLQERRPDIARRFKQLDCPVQLLSTEWFCTLFAAILPSQLTFRIWDCLFLEGTKVLFRAALALLVDAADVGGIVAPDVTSIQEVNFRLNTFIETLQSPGRQRHFLASMFGRAFGSFPLNKIEEQRCTQRFLLAVSAQRTALRRAGTRSPPPVPEPVREPEPDGPDSGPIPASVSVSFVPAPQAPPAPVSHESDGLSSLPTSTELYGGASPN